MGLTAVGESPPRGCVGEQRREEESICPGEAARVGDGASPAVRLSAGSHGCSRDRSILIKTLSVNIFQCGGGRWAQL